MSSNDQHSKTTTFNVKDLQNVIYTIKCVHAKSVRSDTTTVNHHWCQLVLEVAS